NNLLVGVLGNAHLLLDSFDLSPSDLPLVEGIRTAAQRAAELANQMLAYSGKRAVTTQPLDLNELVGGMLNLLKASIPKMICLEFTQGADLPTVLGDATKIRQVIMNLITNAADAIGRDEGQIILMTSIESVARKGDSVQGQKADLPPGEYVSLEVTDSGCGMNAATVESMFDPFFTTKLLGRGLGLAAVQGIVRSHGGTILVSSVPGRGTTFRVLLPASLLSACPAEPPPAARAAASRRRGGTILVVDDEEAVRDVARKMLEREGYEVQTAVDGREALERFSADPSRFSAVLLDVTMPRMGGVRALTEMKRIREDVPIILTTGYDREAATAELEPGGLAGFLRKPFRPDQLVQAVDHALHDGY
ncbi:MAG: response regulator, partial [Planctomycetota bacterium]